MKRLLIALSAVLAAALPAGAETLDLSGSYLCNPEGAAGFRFSETNSQWEPKVFRPDDGFLLKLEKTTETGEDRSGNLSVVVFYKAEIVSPGTTHRTCYGERDGLAISRDDHGVVTCDWMLSRYEFNLVTGRFLNTYLVSYLDGEDTTGNDLSLSIGRCAKAD